MQPNAITLEQLVQYMTQPTEIIQIVEENNWDRYSEIPANSPLLKPFYGYYIIDLEAAGIDVIRVSITNNIADI